MDTPKSNHQRRGSSSPFLMSQTLWSSTEKTCRSGLIRSNDEKGVNVKVVLRCRYEQVEIFSIANSTRSYDNYTLISRKLGILTVLSVLAIRSHVWSSTCS